MIEPAEKAGGQEMAKRWGGCRSVQGRFLLVGCWAGRAGADAPEEKLKMPQSRRLVNSIGRRRAGPRLGAGPPTLAAGRDQNGSTTARITTTIISTVGTSLATR